MEKKSKVKRKASRFLASFFWVVLVLLAILFFWGSINQNSFHLIGFNNFFRFVLQIFLVILGILMVFVSLTDVRKRRIERRKKAFLLRTLKEQKILLQKKFTVNASTLNFALPTEEEKKENVLPKESFILEKNEKNDQQSILSAQTNLGEIEQKTNDLGEQDKIVVEDSLIAKEESFADFSPEWQAFLLENEKKSSVEKLNQMLKIN